ncbi:hypothetical protein V1514DRAFT_330323 [Lipomyces japonicus]|uniref:uncharacterized protein n=1 Tax=Lipomyces japonicus TaxID=56871 RepID=UPI0034CD2D9C
MSEVDKRKRSIDTEKNLTTMVYDFVLWSLSITITLFFREIKSRGAFRIPKSGPVIFVAAPHANQFVDGVVLMNQIFQHSGRRLSYLVAEASMRRKFVGFMCRCIMSIGVDRAQDSLKPQTGRIYIGDKNRPDVIKGQGTKFVTEIVPGGLISIGSKLGSAEVAQVVSDDELVLKSAFANQRGIDALIKDRLEFKFAAKVDQAHVYRSVYERLHSGGCIGIFPEGGSHDRPGLLPLKAGVAVMALGTLDRDINCDLQIVPCGMNYFHPNKFRSRAVVEFGSPFTVPAELVELYRTGSTGKREATQQLLELITNSLQTVTVTSEDYDTLMVIQAARRLYNPPSQKRMPLSLVVELNRRLIAGYTQYKDDRRIIHLREAVTSYNKQLQDLGLLDHQVEYASLSFPVIVSKLVYRSAKLVVLAAGALPGTILFAPVFITTKKISQRKAAVALKASAVKIKARDVVATWKILVALGFAPALYWFYALLATWCANRYDLLPAVRPLWLITVFWLIVLPMITYAALRIGEVGMDIFKSLKPLLIMCLVSQDVIAKLKQTRHDLAVEVTNLINTLGPEVFPDFERHQQQLFANIDVEADDSSESEFDY